jgi:EAL domain-containing protein (putative c-di-GMP-specific phosphodiesterase class I)/ActR/RegA family two-component response regulator
MGEARPAITVVVADDEPHVVDYLRTVLHLEGFVLVGTASDADGAIREVTHLHPDVALLDLHMPGGGLHAAQLIGALAPDTRIVVFSADADEPAVMPLLRAGIHGFVVKGAPPDRIGEAIRSAVEGAAYLAPAVSQVALGALTARLDAEEREQLRRRRERDQVDELIAQARFATVVQPIFDLVSSAPMAVEALTRFTAVPSRTPDEWFDRAEQAGRRVPLELAVSRAALTLIEDLPPAVDLAVNVSPATVLSGRLDEVLIDRPLERVVLELTEHSRVDDYGRLASALRPWRERGARLAVDDAGAGYASFTHVLHLRPELIKLDTDLVRDIHVDPSKQAMARALVGYAREMGVDVVAEGIETEAEQRAVAHLGVRYGQGYHLGRPRPLAEQLGLLEGSGGLAAVDLDLRVGGTSAAVGTDQGAGAHTKAEEREPR